MSRLFLRFYVGVVLILIAAWMIQGYVFRTRSADENVRVVERALGGGARLARERLTSVPREQAESELAKIAANFDYPVRVVGNDQRPMNDGIRQRLVDGEPVFYAGRIEAALPDSDLLLEFGPLPKFVGPSQTVQTVGFGAIFVFAAVAIAVLLRPVAAQLRAVESAATAIAAGDLSSRIEKRRWRRQLPLESAFNSMADRTQALVQSQRELLQAVSHELRTPLARIRFATDLIETSKTPEERQARLQAVDTATQELDDLVGELLTYVRLESDSSDSTELIDVQEMLVELIDQHAPLHPNVSFKIDPASEQIQVTAARSSLARAIGNLLRNAGRFADSEVTLAAFQHGNELLIQVDDDGEGILAADRQRVFEPFVRLNNSIERDSDGSESIGTNVRGTGLGLALVHRIATGHGGHVTISDSPSGGARFQFVVPILPR